MEEGVKESGDEAQGARNADKVGWVKKSSGGILGIWKDRYLLLCKAQLLVFENQDEQKCLETVELGSYERCQDLRALLKRKHRFILIRSPGNKQVHDLKFQAATGEEKELWIKALNDGINKGKNKAFDEVKVDQSCALEHVTRDRVKRGQNRRPPTRSHLKEVANAVSDGLLRLDLDVPDSGPPSLTPVSGHDATVSPPRDTPKPPMPPTKPLPTAEEGARPPAPESLQDGLGGGGPGAQEAEGQIGGGPVAPVGDGKEATADVGQGPRLPPAPPPKILSDKLKVSWENPPPEPSVPTGAEAPTEAGPKEAGKPPTPPPKILSEKLKQSMHSGPSEPAAPSDPQAPDDRENCPPSSLDTSDGAEPGPALETHGAIGERSLGVPRPEEGRGPPASPKTDGPTEGPREGPPPARRASLSDLLSESGHPHPLAGMERKVASEREKTELLLSQVLRGAALEPEGNGAPLKAEVLLNRAVEQLRQATQVLQEIKGLGELNKEPRGRGGDQKQERKDLVTLYRRSVP
ncbi:pleckstrin homology domain-containing family O member 2 isoform X2 [Tachyglossus aculeatus]|uniref:pleckstrin homology domain-containing family O member 2 isoform X2 n=1 Tax=Tachyglossus aculeatus TaxID=9261 RepID=UPI0018F5FAD9|nr:pleckstrin homology domain-containing family O member 2 isoform X2 [Tachyglossus aculeatus]